MTRQILHDESQQQFYCLEDGLRSVIDYQLRDHVMTITHTGVPAALEGRGIAGALTKHALKTAQERGWKVVPACSYAEAYLRRHPEFTQLLL